MDRGLLHCNGLYASDGRQPLSWQLLDSGTQSGGRGWKNHRRISERTAGIPENIPSGGDSLSGYAGRTSDEETCGSASHGSCPYGKILDSEEQCAPNQLLCPKKILRMLVTYGGFTVL